ncbi:CocE/NonD family hydrolase [Paenibacillus sacheonensis]|uniref:CocE/NonD family hydrolase n=1 Tax=Paenibacillus sacheonensis TaxID=742054 RepID=A0A7X4YLQ2_9BACL|nr:CocE/NonD family hydrolase [Paenibacillus sacheonensis]MBM7566022.1 putative CocE/NonD family hydrolase [Paenibacillus sacheonensis]NBC68666.1 CocE/NonD family hydrolase [Paenibacillus sacheonensis]
MRFGDVIVKRNVPCTMRDGVNLYADIYLPEESGEYPVLLMRQPYGRKIASTVSHAHPVWYASRGYMVIVQDVRGRGDSEGEFVPFVHEAEDGYDTVEWAAKLPYSSGKVGMYGFSYQGIAQWAAASLHPPSLATIIPSMTAADIHRWAYPQGSFSSGMLIWAFQLARDSARRAGDTEAEQACTRIMNSPEAVLRRLPLNERHPILAQYCPAYFDWVDHTEYDSYWLSLNWLPAFIDNPIPAFHIGGWYDFLLDGTVQSYLALQETLPERSPDLFHRLEIGPWIHIPWGRKAGGVDHGPDADGDMHRKQAQWFDYWLKGKRDNGLYEEPAVRYFDREEKQWKTSDRYPAHAGGRKWLLGGSGKPANGALGGGRILNVAAEPDAEAAADVFVYDARLPMALAGYAPTDRSAQQDRTEILVYTGSPADKAFSVLGAPVVNVHAQSMEGPTDLVAILTMLLPDGSAKFLSVGRTEIGQSGDGGCWRPARIVMRPLAATFPPGSAIRLELTGSAFPTLIRHPNGIPMNSAHGAGECDLTIAVVAVKSRPGMESWIELPVVEGEA